jgi:hypothetical protein
MRKIFTVLLTAVMIASVTVGCSQTTTYNSEAVHKAIYLGGFRFHSTYTGYSFLTQACIDGEVTSIEFVYSEDESIGFEEGVIVAWPSEDTVIILNNLNRYTIRHDVDLTEYSLTYPITMEDVVERWELVNDYLLSIDTGSQELILIPFPESE